MKKEWTYLLLLCLIAVALFYLSNEKFRGYLRREANQVDIARNKLDSLDYYELTKEAPFKYRLLFSSIVKGSYEIVSNGNESVETYFQTFKFWSLVFYVSSVIAVFLCFRSLGFEEGYSLLGGIVFLVLPPMLLAFTLPVHTREDTLAYTLLFTGLSFLIRDKRIPFLIVALIGVLTRETLLLMPLLYLFYSRDSNIIRRLAIAGLPALLWIAMRLAMGLEKYDAWEGLRWNLNNPEQVIGFLIITFNVCWIPFVIHLFNYRSSVALSNGLPVNFFYRTSIFSLLVILITTFVGGIYNEIRLLYLASPWVIVIFVDFVRNNITVLRASVAKRSFWLYAAIVVVFSSALIYVMVLNWEQFIKPGKFKVPYELWIVVSICYVCVTLLFLPSSFKFLMIRKSYK